MERPVLVSACLLGLYTRYDGRAQANPAVLDWVQRAALIPIPVCPEQLAGLPTPRPRCYFRSGDGATLLDGAGELVNEFGERMNETFLRGAVESLKLACLTGCCEAVLKEGSPSCGRSRIDCNGVKVPGQGVTAALLARNGIAVKSEENF